MRFAQVMGETHRAFVARRLGTFLILALIAILLLAVFAIHPMYGLVDPPAVSTDKTGYLAGSTVHISGSGFQAGEVVSVRVTHADGGAESGMGHDPFYASAGSDGTFTSTWQLTQFPWDTGGNNFVVQATGAASGANVSTAISRIATVQTNQYDYAPGNTALISGAGFRPAESVSIRVEHANGNSGGSGHLPFNAFADGNGRIAASWLVDADDSEHSIFRLTASGGGSGLIATTTFTDSLVTTIDDKGPDDEPGQKDLSQMTFDSGVSAIALSWNWDDTSFGNLGGNTGDGCALIDTDADGFANYSFCVGVDGNPAAQTYQRLYSCGDSRSDRCDQPVVPITTFSSTSSASVVPNSDPFRLSPFNAAHADGNDCEDNANCLTADTVAIVTLQLSDVGGAAARLINVCSYPSGPPNSDPSDCVIFPNSGLLTIKKTIHDVTTLFNDTITFNASEVSQSGTNSWTYPATANVTDAVVVERVSYAPTTALNLTEVFAKIGWQLDSQVAQRCQIQTLTPTGTGTNTATGVTGLEIRSGLETICTFSNTENTGSLKITKTFNALTSGFSGTFAINYSCNDTVAQGGPHTGTVNLLAGASQQISGIFTGTSCVVTEPSTPTPPTGWTFGTPTLSDGQAPTDDGTVVIAMGADNPVVVTNTISRDQGYLKISKVFDALTSGFASTFDIKYNCGAGDVTVTLAAGNSTTVGPFDTGSSCAVTEPVLPTPPTGWTFGTPSIPASPATITKGDAAAAVVVTVTNTISRDQGYLKITKVFDALTSGFVDTFAITYNCGAGDVTVNLAAGNSTTVGPFNTGTSCTLSEPVLPTAPANWTFGTPSFTQPPVITKGDAAAAVEGTVTNTITRDQGYLRIRKVFNPLTSGFNGTFTIDYDCGPGIVALTIAAGNSSTVGPFDAGTTNCTITEPVLPTAPTGWTFGTPSISATLIPITKGDAAAAVLVTVTNSITRDLGSLTITKVVNGGGAGFTGTFGVRAVCNGTTYNRTIDYPTPGFVTITGIPTLLSCTVTETSQSAAPTGYSFAAGVITGSPAVITTGAGPNVTVTNTVTGRAKVTKTVRTGDGPGAPPSSLDSFTFQLRQGASTSAAGTILLSLTATAANGGVLNFTTPLTPGQTYQICEVVPVGWSTTLPNAFVVFDAGGDNSVLCSNFTAGAGTTNTFEVTNSRPPGGLARTIGYWKNWSSCTGGKQAPILDSELPVTVGNLTLSTCQPAVNILDKRDLNGTKRASDPAYNMAAQLLAAILNGKAGALWCPAIDQTVISGQALLKTINFLGTGPYAASMTSLQKTTANTLASLLDSYNNNNFAFCGAPQTVPVSPTITSANNATFTAGIGGTFTVTATGSSPLTLSVVGSLPGGVSFNASTGVLTVTNLAVVGGYNITFRASNFATVTQAFTLNIVP